VIQFDLDRKSAGCRSRGVVQELTDSSATDETSPTDGGVHAGIASLKIYRITTTNVAMNIDENITRSTWETRLQNK